MKRELTKQDVLDMFAKTDKKFDKRLEKSRKKFNEVKYKFHPDDVAPLLDKKIPNFKKLFPMYKDFKIYGAIAGVSVPDGAKKKAIKYGFFVLTQSGDNIKLLNDKVKIY